MTFASWVGVRGKRTLTHIIEPGGAGPMVTFCGREIPMQDSVCRPHSVAGVPVRVLRPDVDLAVDYIPWVHEFMIDDEVCVRCRLTRKDIVENGICRCYPATCALCLERIRWSDEENRASIEGSIAIIKGIVP